MSRPSPLPSPPFHSDMQVSFRLAEAKIKNLDPQDLHLAYPIGLVPAQAPCTVQGTTANQKSTTQVAARQRALLWKLSTPSLGGAGTRNFDRELAWRWRASWQTISYLLC